MELDLAGVAKVFDPGVIAVQNLNLQVEQGELLVLVGPSGCGKTTTLRLIAGLESPTRGTIRLGGERIDAVPPWQRQVAMVFQRPALYPHLNVRDNLLFGLRLSGRVREREIAGIVEIAGILGLQELLGRYPAQLSGGQQQRVALGRALLRRPRLLLLDEPLASLDPRLRIDLRRELHLLHGRFPATILYVTHDPLEALALGDRIAVMNAGTIQQVDRPAILYQRPVNRFVAAYVGWPPMNFLDGRLHREEEQLVFATGAWSLPVNRSGPVLKALVDRPVTLGLRPEAVGCRPVVPPGDPFVPLEVALIEPLGRGVLVTMEDERARLSSLVTDDGSADLRVGEKVMVTFDFSQAYWFDAAAGQALAVPGG